MPQLDQFTYFTQFLWSFIHILFLQFSVSFFLSLLLIFLEESLHRHKKAIVELFKSETFLYFLLICWIFCTFFLFCWFYPLVVGAAEGLVNPLQVIVQLCAILFWRDYPKKIDLLLLSLFGGSLFANLFLIGVGVDVLCLFGLIFLGSFLFFQDKKKRIWFFLLLYSVGFYFGGKAWAYWGFYLAFQQVGYHGLSLILYGGRGPTEPLFIFLVLTGFQFISLNDPFFLSDPLLLQKLAALLSGACLIHIGLYKRVDWGWLLPFFIFVVLSYYSIGPGLGLTLFLFLQLLFLILIVLLKQLLRSNNQSCRALLLIFISILLSLSRFCPELAWLNTWLEGLSLLLQALGIVSLFEGEGGERESKPKPECKSKSNQKNSREDKGEKDGDQKSQSPLDQFAIVPFIPWKIGKLYCSFSNSSFYLLVSLSFVLFVFYLVTKKGGGKRPW